MGLSATVNQQKVLRYVRGYQLAKGFSPTLDEIAAGTGLPSKSGAHRVARQLEERELARWTPKTPRSVELLVEPAIPFAPDGAPLFVVPGFGEVD